MNPRAALDQYRRASLQARVEQANAHQLIQMLMAGALEKIRLARRFMQEGKVAAKGEHISWAISILSGLQTSLDHERGGEIAANLDALYTYLQEILLQANLRNAPELLDEADRLLSTIKEAWDGIADQAQAPARAGGHGA
ncbi:MAG: flagellar export chaperone FliS [Gammaproteobacteria bacterium]|nr:MAG: flagellar export chaperone FliS [Gammaproteobacteria bacterium]